VVHQKFCKVPSDIRSSIIRRQLWFLRRVKHISVSSNRNLYMAITLCARTRNEYTSLVSFPFTCPFSNHVNLSFAPNFASTKSRISSGVPWNWNSNDVWLISLLTSSTF
jgi:hypothetical protein